MDSQSSSYSSFEPSPEERRLNHMIFPQHIPLSQINNTFNMTETDQLRYNTPRGDYPQTHPLAMNLAGPDMDMLMQDIDISSFSLADLDAFCSPQKPSKGNDDIAQFYLQPSDYQSTTVSSELRSSSSMATSSTCLYDQTLEALVNQGLHPHDLNQGPHITAPMQQDPAMRTFSWEPTANGLSSMNDGVMAGLMMGSKESSLLDKKKNAQSFRRRRYHQRHTPNRKGLQSSASGGIKNGTPIPSKTPTMPRENMTSRGMTDVEEKKDDNVDPEHALNLLKRSIETQPYSSISQREMAALIKKIEDVVLREKLYGSSSSDSGEATIPSTVSDSISNSENIEPEYSSDATSVSSTPRLTVDGTPDAEAAEVQTVHKMNCPHCGNKPNYYCSKRGCGYFAHTRGDAKRHEEGEKHYPQARFMCCECPLAHAQQDTNGNIACDFCNTVCFDSGLLRAHYLQCADAKNMGKTFSRKDHFIQHLREEHNIFNDAQYISTSRYPIASNWPRQCSRCPKTFQTWEERMKHLAEHAEEDFHPRGFTKKRKDDDDDDDNDDHHGGGGGSQGKGVGHRIKATLTSQHNHAPTSFNNSSSSYNNYRSRTGTPSEMSEQPVVNMKPSLALERYLNDEENPVPLPLGYQKCESQDQSVTPTLRKNKSEISVDPNHVNGYSNTPDGDLMQRASVPDCSHTQFRHMQAQYAANSFINALKSPTIRSLSSHSGSPLQASAICSGSVDANSFPKQRPRLSQVTQRRPSPNTKRSPLIIKTATGPQGLKHQEPAASCGRTKRVHGRKRSPSPGKPLVAVQDIQEEDAGGTQSIDNSSLQKSPGPHRQHLTGRTTATLQVTQPLSSNLKPYPTYPIPIPSDKHERALQFIAKVPDEVEVQTSEAKRSRYYSLRIISISGCVSEFGALKQRERTEVKDTVIRLRGSCMVCEIRRVPCSLEHHNIEALECPSSLFSQLVSSQGLRDRSDATHCSLSSYGNTRIISHKSAPENVFKRVKGDDRTRELLLPHQDLSTIKATTNHLEELKDLFYKYLVAELSTGVNFMSKVSNLPPFNLDFHIPYFVSQDSSLPKHTLYSASTAGLDINDDFLRRAIEFHVNGIILEHNLSSHISYSWAGIRFLVQVFANICRSRSFMKTLRSGAHLTGIEGTGADLIFPPHIESLGIPALQMKLELAENLGPQKSLEFEVGEWSCLESNLSAWINHMPNYGQPPLGGIVLKGPWGSKEPTSRLSAQELRCNHCFTKDLHDLLKPDRKPSQSMRGDDSVSAVTMETPHVHLKTADNRIDPKDAEPDLTKTDPSRKQSKTGFQIESYTGDQEWRENIKGRIQELSRLLPMRSLEDEEARKHPRNSRLEVRPMLVGSSTVSRPMSPTQATSGLARSEYQQATAVIITTGIQIQEKDKGPDEAGVLDRAASWTRDLMWMLHFKLQQQETLTKVIADLGGTFAVKESKEERRIHTELMEVMAKNDGNKFQSQVIHKTQRTVYETTTASTELENRLVDDRDSGYEASLRGTIYELTAANNEFTKSIANSPTSSQRSLPSSEQPVEVRKASTLSTYLFKLTRKNTEIIDATSDGDIARVAKLIGRGAKVNARDRWGWSALSMSAYGNYLDIARLLLDHGADLDNTDMDGDTPEMLAMARGNMDMVKLLEEERRSRVSERSVTPQSLARDMEA